MNSVKNVKQQLTFKSIEMFLLNLLFDNETQQRIVKTFFKYVGINKEKCPSARQILRVNGILLSSVTFFLLTWIVFYLLTFMVFLSIAYGVNFMVENI